MGETGCFPHESERSERLIAPVEVARAPPEAVVDVRNLKILLARPGMRRSGHSDCGLGPVHRLLETSLLLGLEERVVIERIVGLVALERHLTLELRVPALQLEMFLDDLAKNGRGLYRHTVLQREGHVSGDCNGFVRACLRDGTPRRGRRAVCKDRRVPKLPRKAGPI